MSSSSESLTLGNADIPGPVIQCCGASWARRMFNTIPDPSPSLIMTTSDVLDIAKYLPGVKITPLAQLAALGRAGMR